MGNERQVDKRLYDKLISKLTYNEPVEDLLQNYNPITIRDIVENSTSDYLKNKKIADVRDLFERPELLSHVQVIENPNLPKSGLLGKLSTLSFKDGTHVPDSPMKLHTYNKNDLGTMLHEYQHGYDQISQPKIKQLSGDSNILEKIKDELDLPSKIKKMEDLRGLEQATAYHAGHFKPDVINKFDELKQLINLKRIIKGNPLKILAPLAIGASAAGIANEANAGELKEAALDTANLSADLALSPVSPLGILKQTLWSDSVGKGSDIVPNQQLNKSKIDQQKIRRVMENR